MRRQLSIPVLAALLFGAFGALAAASMQEIMLRFADEAGIEPWVFIAVPALMTMFFALIVYGRAATRVRSIGQSLSRGLLVAILTWLAFSALVTWAWCVPSLYASCLSQTLLISGVLGGGQMLLAALAAAAITGYVIRLRSSGAAKPGS